MQVLKRQKLVLLKYYRGKFCVRAVARVGSSSPVWICLRRTVNEEWLISRQGSRFLCTAYLRYVSSPLLGSTRLIFEVCTAHQRYEARESFPQIGFRAVLLAMGRRTWRCSFFNCLVLVCVSDVVLPPWCEREVM